MRVHLLQELWVKCRENIWERDVEKERFVKIIRSKINSRGESRDVYSHLFGSDLVYHLAASARVISAAPCLFSRSISERDHFHPAVATSGLRREKGNTREETRLEKRKRRAGEGGREGPLDTL